MRNECRVATHIIAGLYPLNFSKFLIKAYQPLKEEERKELMNIQKLYFSYLMQKISDDKSQKVDMLQQMDLLWNIDDAEYTLFCDIGSAFAECYLIDMPIPVQELLDSCFIPDNGDIELNTCWLECIYMFKESDNSPLKKIENDPKVLEFQLRMQMDQISSINDVGSFTTSSETAKLMTASTSSDKLIPLFQLPNDDSETDDHEQSTTTTATATATTAANTTTAAAAAATITTNTTKKKFKPEQYEKLRALLDVVKNESKAEKKDDENATKECSHSSTAAVKFPSTLKANSSTKVSNEIKCKKHDLCDKDNATEKDVSLADAVKIAVKQQLNQ